MFENPELLESLINRQYFDMNGTRGWILSTSQIPQTSKCEISLRFTDGSCMLNSEYSAQEWFDRTTESVRKIVEKRE